MTATDNEEVNTAMAQLPPEALPQEAGSDSSLLAHNVALVIPPVPGVAGEPPVDDIMDKPARLFLMELLSQMLAGNAKDATLYATVPGPGGSAMMVGFTINIAGVKDIPAPPVTQPKTVADAVAAVLDNPPQNHVIQPATGRDQLFGNGEPAA